MQSLALQVWFTLLQSLETCTDDFKVLGGPDGTKTRRLVRALLADPLLPEQEWEKHLLSLDDSDGRALLLRFVNTSADADEADWTV